MAVKSAGVMLLTLWLLLIFGSQCHLADVIQLNAQIGNPGVNPNVPSEDCKPKCKHDGTCQMNVMTNETKCLCPAEYYGKSCQKRAKCDPICSNNSTCIRQQIDSDGKQQSACWCAQGWMGDTCEEEWKCDPVCENGGSCQYGYMNKPYCQCSEGWMGESCEDPIECDPPCKHGGTCVQTSLNTTGCACKPEWYGETCKKAAKCDPPCENNGTCTTLDQGNTTICQCQGGFYGFACELEIICDPPCDEEGGHCEFFNYEQNITKCWCDPGFYGKLCEKEATCKPKCTNGGSCNYNTQTNKSECYCNWAEWKGSACQYRASVCEFNQTEWTELGTVHQECDFVADNKICNFYCLGSKKDCKTNYTCKYKTGDWKPELPKCKQMSEKELYMRDSTDDFCVNSRALGYQR